MALCRHIDLTLRSVRTKIEHLRIVSEVTAGEEEGSVDYKDGNDEGEPIVNPGLSEQEI